MRCFGLEMHGGMLGLGIGARELIDYTAEVRVSVSESVSESVSQSVSQSVSEG